MLTVPPCASEDLGVFFADGGVVGDARAGHQHAQQAAAVRLNFAQLFLLQQSQSGEAVGFSAIEQGVEARDLLGAGGDDDFAADFVRQVVGAAKFHHGGRALDAEFRLQRSRLVVNAGVDHAAVVSALVAGDTVFLFDQQQAQVRQGAGGVHRSRETDDSSANDYDVESLIRHRGAGKPAPHSLYMAA